MTIACFIALQDGDFLNAHELRDDDTEGHILGRTSSYMYSDRIYIALVDHELVWYFIPFNDHVVAHHNV